MLIPARRNVPERLDREDNPLDEHLAGLKDLQWFNAKWGGTRIVLGELERLLGAGGEPQIQSSKSKGNPNSIIPSELQRNGEPETGNREPAWSVLDVGTGSADIPREIAAWGRGRGVAVRAIGLDLHPLHLRLARRETRGEPAVALIRGNALRLPLRDGSVDVAMCSLFLHHFTEAEAVRLLREFRRVARRAVLVFDLRRSRLLWAGLKLLTAWKARSPITAYDGPVSALRAFTPIEVSALARQAGMGQFEVVRRFPFRLCLRERTCPARTSREST